MFQKRSDVHFKYPGNLNTLDLATMVQLYRMRGEPHETASGEVIACALSRRLLKQSKKWFGLHYSQKSWDKMLTTGCEGYPLTDVELNILGLFHTPPVQNMDRSFVEKNCGVLPQLAFLIINDLKQFQFLEEDDIFLNVTPRGVKALDGIARRIFERKFMPEMLDYYHEHGLGHDHGKETRQTRLF